MHSLPSWLCLLSSLQELYLDGNPFQGPCGRGIQWSTPHGRRAFVQVSRCLDIHFYPLLSQLMYVTWQVAWKS